MIKRIETVEDLMEISGTAAAELRGTKKTKPSKLPKITKKFEPTEKKKVDDRENWVDLISPHTGDTIRIRSDKVDYLLSLAWKKVEKFVAPETRRLPLNTYLWYWAKKEPSDIAPYPSVNYYFRSLEMAQQISNNCYPIIDITGCQWWMVHFYNHNEPLEEIHDWCLKNAKNYRAGSFWSDVEDISASRGWEKSVNNLSEFRKHVKFKQIIDKKGKEVWYVWEKEGKSGYRWEATGTDDKTADWEFRQCFESRTRRIYTTDDGKYALVVRNMDWTRFYRLNKIIPSIYGSWTCRDGDGYPGSTKILFDKESRRDIILKVLKQWYG